MLPFKISNAEEVVAFANSLPMSDKLYLNLWRERELACVLGENSAAAADAALRVAEAVSETRKVLYINISGTYRSFAERCRATKPRNLLHAKIDLADIDSTDPMAFLKDLARTIKESGAKVCVVDSLFYLCEWYNKAGAARYFITKFLEIKDNLGISILIGANARRRIGKGGAFAEHLPKGTAPYIDTIIFATPEEAEEAQVSEEATMPSKPYMAYKAYEETAYEVPAFEAPRPAADPRLCAASATAGDKKGPERGAPGLEYRKKCS